MAKSKNTAIEVIEEIDDTEATEVEVVTPKQIAARLGLDPKSFRRWLRRHTGDRAGKGGRWNFTPEEAEELVAAYQKPEPKAEEAEGVDLEALIDEVLDLDDEA